MNRAKLKNYAPQARRDFIQAMTDRAAFFGLTAKKIEPVVEKGDVAVIGGRSHPRAVANKRKQLEERIARHGFEQTMEALAYTWFNRLVAIRFMELHDYLDHGYRVLSPRPATEGHGKNTEENKNETAIPSFRVSSVSFRGPEILEHAEHVELPGLKKETVIDLKLAGNKESELYRLLLTAQCNALHAAMPFLFEKIDDETELLLPDNLLHSDSVIRKLVGEIDEADWQAVEIIGWLYQFYISEKKDEVIGKVVASEDIPAATQLFTPNWIVKYLVQNTLGRQWLATYPHSALRQQMAYYIEPAEQTPEVQEQLKAITPTSLNPEELTLLDPACGSGHILVEAYDLFKAIYQERGYRAKDIPALILQKNLFGLEIDDRAAQLADLALMMKARADDRRIFDSGAKPNVIAIQETTKHTKYTKEDLQPIFGPDADGSFSCVSWLMDLFENAKTFGSLIQAPAELAAKLPEIEKRLDDVLKFGDLTHAPAQVIKPLLQQARLLSRRYDAVVANPPYMGSRYYSSTLKIFVNREFLESKADLYSCFITRNCRFAKPSGFVGMITIPNWMFLASFEDIRKSLLSHQTIDTFIHNGRGVFGSDFGSCAFAFRNAAVLAFKGNFRRLFSKQGSVASNEELEERFFSEATYSPRNTDFAKIPGSPLAYWIGNRAIDAFTSRLFRQCADIRSGIGTSDNGRFLRYWWEVSESNRHMACASREEALQSGRRWFPYNKGGGFRKWYGNRDYLVNWEKDGEQIKQAVVSNPNDPHTTHWSRRIFNTDLFFLPSLTWNDVGVAGFSARASETGFIHDAVGVGAYGIADDASTKAILALLNSCVAKMYMEILCPTVHFKAGQVGNLPIIIPSGFRSQVSDECIEIARTDWDSFETSWDFQTLPVMQSREKCILQSQEVADSDSLARFARMKELEEENNRLFIDAYGLQGELLPEVPDDQITLYRPDRTEDMNRLLSYAIGCMMGRYSLDKPGLIYAHGGNQGFAPSQYESFGADDDGIIPLLENDWGIRDDAANRIVEFIGIAWPKEHLEENLKFIADSLGPNNGEQPLETIRHYFATGFYKHHLSMYKRRPIYWLFSSGKKRAFQCLVYLHRYHEGTLARMRTEYVIPLQGQIAARIEQLEGDKAKATSTSHRRKLQKEQDDLKKQQAELATFEEKLKHFADQKISLDLDDGVKVNYGKFGDLLAEAKAITGGKDEE